MLTAIGIVIVLKQLPHAFGDDKDTEGDFSFSQADHENTFTEILTSFIDINPGALIISLSCMLLLIFWERLAAGGLTLFRTFPASLGAVLLGVGINEVFHVLGSGLYLGNSPTHMVSIPVLRSLSDARQVFDFPDFSTLGTVAIWTSALTLALVASLESLLSLEAADAIDPQRRNSSANRELLAQGVGNILSGMVGGLPVTSVVVRTSANVYAGARTRMSAFMHGLLLLAAVVVFPVWLNRIPLSALAAILIMVGYKLAKPSLFIKQYKEGPEQFIPFIATILLVVFSDLLTGIAIGTIIGLGFVVYSNFHSALTIKRQGHEVRLIFNKDVYFLNKGQVKAALMGLQEGDHLYVDASKATFIDHDVFNMLREIRQAAPQRGITVRFDEVFRKRLFTNAVEVLQ